MATGIHSLSVATNSCIKSPINPKSGLTFTKNEREGNELNVSWHGFEKESKIDEKSQANMKTAPAFTSSEQAQASGNLKKFQSDLSNLTDDEFYKKLLELKEEHKKTLSLYEQMYQEKLSARSVENDLRLSTTPAVARNPVAMVSKDFVLTTKPLTKEVKDTLNSSLGTTYQRCPRDNLKDFSGSAAKPPRPKTADPTNSVGRHSKRNILKSQALGTQSMDENYWKTVTSSDSEVDEDEVYVKKPLTVSNQQNRNDNDYKSTKALAMSHIEDMWKEFEIENYAPRPRSASLSRLEKATSSAREKKAEKEAAEKEWRHRVTIPKPFKMTLREEKKQKPVSRSLEQFERERLEKEKQEEIECQKKFKAKPVPAHVYMPLFDEIMEEKESRKRYIRDNRAELLKSIEKPFKFTEREKSEKVERLVKSAPFVTKSSPNVQKTKKEFKAKPFPVHIFENDAMEKIQEEEEYRKIRMQMRAEELLRSASLPPTMEARGKAYTDGKSRQKMYADRAKKAHLTVEHKFKPKINQEVPDFDELHRQFMKEMVQKKYAKESTVAKPFNLRTEMIPSKRNKVYDDIERDEQTLKENRWPFKTPRRRVRSGSFSGSLSASLDSIPAKMTQTAHLRSSRARSRLDQAAQEKLHKQQQVKRQVNKEKELRKQVLERAAANDKSSTLKDTNVEKLKQFRRAERERMMEYRNELDDMMVRVQQRPLLFERTSQAIAKQKAEKKYQATLREAGLDEEFVAKKGSDAPISTSGSARGSARTADSTRNTITDVTGESDDEADKADRTYTYSGGQYSDDFDEAVSERTPEQESDQGDLEEVEERDIEA